MRTGTHECFAVSITTALADAVSETGVGRVPLNVPSVRHQGFSKAGSTCSGVAYVDVGTLLRGQEGKVISSWTRVEPLETKSLSTRETVARDTPAAVARSAWSVLALSVFSRGHRLGAYLLLGLLVELALSAARLTSGRRPSATSPPAGAALDMSAAHIMVGCVPLRRTQTRLAKLFLDGALRELVH